MNHSLGSCLKTVIDFSHFSLDSGMFSKETEGNVHMYERIYRFLSRWIRKKEKYANSKWVLRNLFCWRSNESNNDKISLTWKRVQPETTADMATLPYHWFPRQMTSEKRAQKFHGVSTQIWVVLLIGWIKFPTRYDLSESLPSSGWWHVVTMEFLNSFFRRFFAGKPVVASWNVSCFLRLV